MKLALELGMTLQELKHRMTSAELTDWFSYFAIEAEPRKDEPIVMQDPEAHARLIKQKLFKG